MGDVGIMIQRGYHNFVASRQLTADRTGQREREWCHVLPEDDLSGVAVQKSAIARARRRWSRR